MYVYVYVYIYVYKCLRIYQLIIIKKIKKAYEKKLVNDIKIFLTRKKKASIWLWTSQNIRKYKNFFKMNFFFIFEAWT